MTLGEAGVAIFAIVGLTLIAILRNAVDTTTLLAIAVITTFGVYLAWKRGPGA